MSTITKLIVTICLVGHFCLAYTTKPLQQAELYPFVLRTKAPTPVVVAVTFRFVAVDSRAHLSNDRLEVFMLLF